METGTSQILSECLRCIESIHKKFSEILIGADLKTMDGAGLEAEMMLKAGANMVVVMGQMHDASIIEQVKIVKKCVV